MTRHPPDRASGVLIGVLVAAAIITSVALAIGSGRELAVMAGVPVAAGTGLSISPRKLVALTAVAGALGVLAAVMVWRALSGSPRAPRQLAALACLLVVAGPPWLLAGHANPAIYRLEQRLAFVTMAWPQWHAWSDPASPQRQSADWPTLSDHARRWITSHAQDLPMPADIDAATRQALATMYLVAQVWGPGNRRETGREGCVRSNEDNGWRIPDTVTLNTYLRARIACCDDFAHALHWLLREQGFESRMVTAGGHIFVEARLPGGWRMLDAFAAIYVDAPFEHVNRGGRARVFLGPHAAEWSSTDLYREDFPAERWRLLTTLFVGGFATRMTVDLPPPFPARVATLSTAK